jgi:hypothetical protein
MTPHVTHETWEAMSWVGDLLLLLRLVLGGSHGRAREVVGQLVRLAANAVGSIVAVAEERHWLGPVPAW